MTRACRWSIACALAGALFTASTARGDDAIEPLVRQLLAVDTDHTAKALAAARLRELPAGREAIRQALGAQLRRADVIAAILACLQAHPDAVFLEPLLDLHSGVDDPALRTATRTALRKLDPPVVLTALLARARDPAVEGARRRDAVSVVGYLGSWRDIGVLLELCDSHADELGPTAIVALRELTRLDWDAAALPRWKALWSEIATSTDADAYRAILAALYARQQERMAELEQEVRRYLDPADPKQNVLALSSALPGIRALAAAQLVALASHDPKLHRAPAAAALLEQLARETHPLVNAQLARGAGVLELTEAEPRLRALLGFVESVHAQTIMSPADRQALALQLVRALGTLKSVLAVDSVGAIAQASWATEEIHVSGIRALGKIGGSRAFELLAARARDSRQASATLLVAVAEVLGDFPEAGPLLVQLLDHAQPDVRSRGADSLRKLGPRLPPDVVGPAIERLAFRLLSRDDPPYVRAAAGLALGELGRLEGVEPLVRALAGDEDPLVRRQAAEALGRLGRAEAAPALEVALADADPKARDAAWTALFAVLAREGAASLLARADAWYSAGVHPDPARKIYEHLLAETPVDQVERRFGLERKIARALQRAGKPDLARPQLEVLLGKAPEDTELALWLAQALASGESTPADLDRARTLLERFPELPTDERGWWAAALRVGLELRRDPTAAKALLAKLRGHDAALGGAALEAEWARLATELDKALPSK